jgi:hypothetical protein
MCFGASENGQAEVETEDGLLLAPMGEDRLLGVLP